MLFLSLLLSAVSARAGDRLPFDTFLYHVGGRKVLEEDIRANTVPEKAWDEFIFGKTNFDLPDYRKGLYGAEAVAGTSLYALYETLSGSEPWLMVIEVKRECLTGDAVFNGGYDVQDAGDPKAGPFSRWYNAHRGKYENLEKDCLADFNGNKSWEEGAPYDVSMSDPETQRLTKLCTPVLDDFLRDTHVKVVSDAVNDNSWYIRDRSCIAGITGTPDALFDRFLSQRVGNSDDDFVRNFFGDAAAPGTFFAGSTYLFLGAAAEATHLGKESLPKLAALRKTLDDYIGQEKAPAIPNLERSGDHPFLLRRVVHSLGRAIQKGRSEELQKGLRDWLASARAKMGATCQGKHGVPNERRAACSRLSDELSKSLSLLLD